MHASYLIPLKTVSGMNAREHYMVRKKRVAAERQAVRLVVKPFPTPCIVRMIRISSGQLDTDNLHSAMKSVRDEISSICGCGDSPSDPITWVVDQEKGAPRKPFVRVEFLAV